MNKNESIKFMSRFDCKKLIRNGVDDDTVIISINDTLGELDEMQTLLENSQVCDYIALHFSDVEKGEKGAMLEDHARRIVEFVNRHHSKIIYVHCFIGVSRSGAIAKWINAYLERGIMYLEDYMGYNRHVYDMLDRQIGNSMSAYYEQLEER